MLTTEIFPVGDNYAACRNGFESGRKIISSYELCESKTEQKTIQIPANLKENVLRILPVNNVSYLVKIMDNEQFCSQVVCVDEGFGSLDDETLQQAMKALNSLSETNRLIGIISHVAELRRVIDRQIIVKKRPGGGSKIDSINV